MRRRIESGGSRLEATRTGPLDQAVEELPQDMTTDYPNGQEAVNEQDQPKPGFYAIIPAPVRYCKELPSSAKLLFGEITALCTREGYCWASNAYFQHLYDVDRSTIQRWLSSLAKQGFISVVYNPETQQRIIRDLTVNVPAGGGAQKRATPSAETRPPRRKNEAHSITLSNTANTTGTLNVADARFKGPGPVPASELQGKGSASPPTSTSWKSVWVADVVALTGDTKSVLRFRQLLDIADDAGCSDVWPLALDALKAAQTASTGPVERPGAYFCSVVVSLLSERQVYVPVGVAKERRAVRSQIAASLALGSEASE